ncbi:MAG: beta-galactosidase [Bryobacterales bacterium]|nr:beta-galactosidase [Bryobacterales bacterium]MEB2360383.1 beta-galactosidase trimerization domain-containing protein [Bryobacterales bacterium]
MAFRYWLSTLVFGLLVATGTASAQSPSDARLPKPSWLGKEPLVIVGNWDSMPIFRRRVGGTPAWQEEDYAREHTEEAVLKLKELGVTMAVIHFYKGYGLEAEKEHMADARRLADLCKKHGIRVGVYVGSTIAYETFLHEEPKAKDWFVERHLGRPVVYGDQTFRKRVYFMHPGYREYMKRVVTIAIRDFKADLIHFDNTSLQAQPAIFFHPMAVEDFRAFLRKKYTPDQLKRRFGFSDVSFVEPPEIERTPVPINDPMHQEWADFRCEQLTAYYAEMERLIRSLNPETAVESNPHSGISGRNVVWEQGVDYARFLPHMDVVWTEEGNEPGVTKDDILISKIRTFKMAAKYNTSIFTYTGGGRGGKLAMAEAMAFNRQNLGMVGGALAGYELPEEQRTYIRFYRDRFHDLYRDVQNRADVAVLHGFASMAYNSDLPWQSSMLFEQALIQAKVPFDIIFDEHLRDLSKYRVLVLPDQESMSDAQAALVREYVRRGGGLVATGHASLFTEERRRRRNFALADLFGIDAPAYAAGRAPERIVDSTPVRNELGKGRIVYIPQVQPAMEKPSNAAMTSQYWKLPLNWHELIDAVKWAAGGELSLDVQAPPHVTAELIDQKDRVLVHLLNYAAERGPVSGKIAVSVAIPQGRKVGAAHLVSPDHPVESLQVAMRGNRAQFAAPRLDTYGVAVLELQ